MKKIGICGHFNTGFEAIGGQTIKTRIISETLEEIYESDQILKLDTEGWKKNKIKFFLKCFDIVIKSENIIIIPAQNGVKILIPLFNFIAKILKRKVHYIIVGAWLPSLLDNNRYLVKHIRNVDYIYAQTNTLIEKLSVMNIDSNTYVMSNFKRVQPININLENIKYKKPYKLCIVSRINYKKGIESAINVVNRLNKEYNELIVKLDIYGPIEEVYEERFDELLIKHNDAVKYKGIIDYNVISEVIKEYFLLLFPTKYYTEGFPGTILDAYLSGVPVLASRWESWEDIINEGITGCTFEFNNENDFYEKLKYLIQDQDLVLQMKMNCQVEASKYSPKKAIQVLVDNIK